MSGAPPLDAKGPVFLPQVESLRGYAALCVAFSHCGIALIFTPAHDGTSAGGAVDFGFKLLSWVLNGRAAVIVFFVISGLVLSLALDRAPVQKLLRGYGLFVWRRALRIYPAHLAALLLFVPAAYLTVFRVPVADPARLESVHNMLTPWIDGFVYGHIAPSAWWQTAVLSSNYYNPVTWTLKVEMLASLLVPLFAALSRPARLGRDLLILADLIAAASLIDANTRPDLFLLYLPAFYLGCMVRTHGRRLAAVASRGRPSRPLAILVCLLALIGPSAAVPLGTGNFETTISMSVAAFGLVLLVAWPTGEADRLLLHPLSRMMGRLSYSFYLWHDLILFAFVRALFVAFAPDTLAAAMLPVLAATLLVTIPFSFAVAALSYRWVEKPFVALGRSGWIGARMQSWRPLPR
jgi:peptidoglycan/LPS O-acetylase OafA/YrhL